MKHIVVILILSSLAMIGCTEVGAPGPVSTLSSETPSSLAKGKPLCPAKVKYAGKTYNTVVIGSQCWLKENLDVGTMVSGTTEQTNNSMIEKYCFSDDPANCATYGGLYQWNEAMQYSTTEGTQGICPKGWHVPTLAEFQILSASVGGDGNALKMIGQGGEAGAGSNTSGFSALLVGMRGGDGNFNYLGGQLDVWSSTEYYALDAYFLILVSSGSDIYLSGDVKNFGFSVRCIKD